MCVCASVCVGVCVPLRVCVLGVCVCACVCVCVCVCVCSDMQIQRDRCPQKAVLKEVCFLTCVVIHHLCSTAEAILAHA